MNPAILLRQMNRKRRRALLESDSSDVIGSMDLMKGRADAWNEAYCFVRDFVLAEYARPKEISTTMSRAELLQAIRTAYNYLYVNNHVRAEWRLKKVLDRVFAKDPLASFRPPTLQQRRARLKKFGYNIDMPSSNSRLCQ